MPVPAVSGVARRRGVAALAVAAALAAASPAGAADGGVALPLKAPAGADPLVADFIEICSAGVLDVARGAALALERGWATGNGEPNEKTGGLASLASAAFGTFAAMKPAGDGVTILSINRMPYPHVAATNCLVSAAEADAGTLDPAAIARIEGVRGGGGVIALAAPKMGFWSLVDREGEIVTISSLPAGRNFVLSMSRSVRLDPDTGLPLKGNQAAR